MSTPSLRLSCASTTMPTWAGDSARRDAQRLRHMPRSGSIHSGPNCWRILLFAVTERARAGRYALAAARWARLLMARRPADRLRVFYGHDRVPAPGDPVAGGTAKFQRLASRFPNSSTDFTLLYLGSTWLPRDLRPLLWLARRRRAPVVVNQSGVAYPGWAGDATAAINRPLRRALHAADHVLYPSEFCKRSADEFLGEHGGTWEVLYNAADVHHFTPGEPPAGPPTLLLGGDQTQAYRLEAALRTLALLPDAR